MKRAALQRSPRPCASRPSSKVGLDLLDERQHVAHAEDAARHAIGVERLELVELLAGTREEDRLADDFLHRQRRATARVAVDLGEDHAVETDRVVERLGDVHRFLTGHRVDDEQRVVRLAPRRGSSRSSSMSSASICSRPAVSTITTLRPRRCASSIAPRADARPDRSARCRTARRRAPRARAAARPRPGAAGRHRRAAAAGPATSAAARACAAAVVFPEPCRPASISDRRRLRAHRELAGGAAERLRRAPRARS